MRNYDEFRGQQFKLIFDEKCNAFNYKSSPEILAQQPQPLLFVVKPKQKFEKMRATPNKIMMSHSNG
jgi:hypothetical protein